MSQRQPKTEKAFGNGREKGGSQGSGSKLHAEMKTQDKTLHKIAKENEKAASQRAAAEHAVSSAAAAQQLAAANAAAEARALKMVEEREARLKAAVASGKFKWTAEEDDADAHPEPAAAAGSSASAGKGSSATSTSAGVPKKVKVVDEDGWEVVQSKRRLLLTTSQVAGSAPTCCQPGSRKLLPKPVPQPSTWPLCCLSCDKFCCSKLLSSRRSKIKDTLLMPPASAMKAVVCAAALCTVVATNANPAQGGAVVLPLGDSITFGCGSDATAPGYWAYCTSDCGGYRWPLYQYATAAGYALSYVGSVNMSGPPGLPQDDRKHEGHPGWRTDQILAINATWLAYKPDIILIHLGTNDIGQNKTVSSILTNMRALLHLIHGQLPQAAVYVATILNMSNPAHPQWTPVLQQYNAGLPAVVAAAVSGGQTAYLVDVNQQTGLCPYGGQAEVNGTLTQVCCNGNQPGSSNDWVHPTGTGYTLMAKAWWGALQRTKALTRH